MFPSEAFSVTGSVPPEAIIASSSSSEMRRTPSLVAFWSFAGPIFSPATKKSTLADTAARFFTAVRFDQFLQFVAAVTGESARDDEIFARQTFRFEGFVRGFGLQPRFAQPLDDPQVLRVGEVVDDGIGDLAAHLVGFDQLFARGVHHGIQRAEVCRQVFGRGFPDESDAQGEQYPLKRNLDRAPDAPDDVLG